MDIEINNKMYSVAGSAELNGRISENKANRNIQMDILSEICQGRDTSKYGAETDKVMSSMGRIFSGVKNGNEAAICELNAVQSIVIEKQLVNRLNLLGRLALGDNVPLRNEYDDTVEFTFSYRTGEAAKVQDYHSTFPFATYSKGKATMKLKQITAGAVTEYYRVNDQTIATFARQSQDAVNELYNIAEKYMFTTGYELIKDFKSSVKLFSMGAGGISKVKVDRYIGYLRRVGQPVIYGTYSMIMQMETWDSYDTGNGGSMYSQAHMDDIRNTGVIARYRGCPVVLINEGIDMSSVTENAESGQKWYSSVLPEGLMYIVPSTVSGEKVLRFAFGKLNAMADKDINTAKIAKRWDLSFGAALIPTALPFIAFIGDDRYPVTL